jgi:hypothetical protein
MFHGANIGIRKGKSADLPLIVGDNEGKNAFAKRGLGKFRPKNEMVCGM